MRFIPMDVVVYIDGVGSYSIISGVQIVKFQTRCVHLTDVVGTLASLNWHSLYYNSDN